MTAFRVKDVYPELENKVVDGNGLALGNAEKLE